MARSEVAARLSLSVRHVQRVMSKPAYALAPVAYDAAGNARYDRGQAEAFIASVLAERAGTSQAAVSAYESGRRSPSVDTLCRILGAAGFEVRMRLAPPDTHGPSQDVAETIVPAEQVARHDERERVRVERHRVSA